MDVENKLSRREALKNIAKNVLGISAATSGISLLNQVGDALATSTPKLGTGVAVGIEAGTIGNNGAIEVRLGGTVGIADGAPNVADKSSSTAKKSATYYYYYYYNNYYYYYNYYTYSSSYYYYYYYNYYTYNSSYYYYYYNTYSSSYYYYYYYNYYTYSSAYYYYYYYNTYSSTYYYYYNTYSSSQYNSFPGPINKKLKSIFKN